MAETVLITGASGGLGLEFARIFASRGYNLILAARSLDKLQAIAAELSGDKSIYVDVIQADRISTRMSCAASFIWMSHPTPCCADSSGQTWSGRDTARS